MAIVVQRESDTTKARFVVPAYIDRSGQTNLSASDRPFPTIDVNHLRLHEGNAHFIYKLYPSGGKLASSASIDIAIAFPSGVNAHTVFFYECAGSAEFYVYENPETAGGTPMTIVRRNRNNATTSAGAAVLAPTVTDLGTEIYADFIASGQGGTASGGSGYSFEFVLDDLTTYLFRLTNTSAQDREAELRIEWYE